MINVYKRTLSGLKLIGWVDDEGNTYKNDWSKEGRLINWSMDEQGTVYTEFMDNPAPLGWIEDNGDGTGRVHNQFGKAYGGGGSRGMGMNMKPRFTPGVVAIVNTDGEIYGRRFPGIHLIGKIEGSSDLRQIGALALAVMFY